MITEVKETIRNRLVGDTVLLEKLQNPTDEFKRVFWQYQPETPALPYVLLAADFGIAEPLDRELLSCVGTLTVSIWARTNVFEEIAERVIYLLHQVSLSAVHAVRCVFSLENGELYDEQLNAYGKVLTFTLFTRRAIL